MKKNTALLLFSGALFVLQAASAAQKTSETPSSSIPIATQILLEGVRNSSGKDVVKSVLMIVCEKDRSKGTGFVIFGAGVVATNNHVIGGCSADELYGVSSASGERVKFTSLVKDANRDVVALCPEHTLPYSLRLGGDERPPVETEVETWGYPLRYEGPAPILSRGYVAGYIEGRDSQGRPKTPRVEHLVVNGALNPGNSGGPLIDRSTGKVIGIVVEKWTPFSPEVETVINALEHSPTRTSSSLQRIDANGNRTQVWNEEIIAAAIKELYDKSQVMVGEAISVSELNAFIGEKNKDLSCSVKH